MKENEMIFGTRAVIEAVLADKQIDRILVKREMSNDLTKELFDTLRGRQIVVQRVPEEKLNRLTRKNHQGVIAFISPIVYQELEQIVPFLYEAGKMPFIVLLDGITDVRNFGAIARTCECAGVDAIVIPQRGSVSVGSDAVKTSAGALLRLPVCKERSILSSVQFLKESGYTVVAATEKGAQPYTGVDYNMPIALVLGSEDEGIQIDVLRQCDELVRIPLRGSIGSLNVSVAAGVLIYEVLRSRDAE